MIVFFHLKVRKCEDYYDELKECKNMRARFHQHFIYGESLPCDQWETDYKNCMKFKQTRSPELRVSSKSYMKRSKYKKKCLRYYYLSYLS